MFGTLKVGKRNKSGSMVFIEDNRPNRGMLGSPHVACKNCRDKKAGPELVIEENHYSYTRCS